MARRIDAKEEHPSEWRNTSATVPDGTVQEDQGRHARQITLIAIAIVAAAGAWTLRGWLEGRGADNATQTAVPLVVLGASLWAAFRLIQLPVFADFLIAVEAEMSKVSWPTRSELIKASLVVIFVIFFLAILLFAFDLIWKNLFGLVLG